MSGAADVGPLDPTDGSAKQVQQCKPEADFNETRHFVTCIREDRTPWSNLEDLVKTMKFCEVIVEGVKGTV